MRSLRWLMLLSAFLLGGLPALWAKSSGDTTANFLKMGVGARGVAMGEAQTAAVDDATSLYWNPAGLGGLTQSEITFMHNAYVQGVDQDVLYFARPTKSLGILGIGGSFLRVNDIEGFDSANGITSDVAASDTLLTFGWAKPWDDLVWFPGLQTGVNVKVLQKKLDQESAVGFMGDFGLIYEARGNWNQGLKTGIVLQNVGTGLKFESEKASFPSALKVGVAYPLFGNNLTLAGDAVLPTDSDPFVNLGVDYRIWDILAFRLGYKGNNDLDSGLTYGFGIGNERLHLDYAFVPFGIFGDSHRVSLGLRFGPAYRQVKVTTQVDTAYQRALARYAQGYMVDAYMQANQILAVAPWHRSAKLLSRRIESEFKQMENEARREQLQAQVDDHFARGEQFFQLDDLLRARREFQTILALQPDHMGAKTYLNRIDERFQSLTESFYDMALHAFSSQDFVQAGDLVDKVLLLNPEHPEARELKARVDQVQKQYQEAAEAKRREETILPLALSGRELFDQKRYKEALVKFNEILAIDTADEDARRLRDMSKELIAKDSYNAGLRAAQDGDLKAASYLATEALRYKEDYPEAKELLKTVGQQKSQVDEEKSKELYKESLDAFLAGDPQRALELAQQALSLWPLNVEAQRMRDRLTQRGTDAP